MAWLAVSKSGTEYIFRRKPHRGISSWTDETTKYEERLTPSTDGYFTHKFLTIDKYSSEIKLPKGTIRKLIGRDLTWKDDPVEYVELVDDRKAVLDYEFLSLQERYSNLNSTLAYLHNKVISGDTYLQSIRFLVIKDGYLKSPHIFVNLYMDSLNYIIDKIQDYCKSSESTFIGIIDDLYTLSVWEDKLTKSDLKWSYEYGDNGLIKLFI